MTLDPAAYDRDVEAMRRLLEEERGFVAKAIAGLRNQKEALRITLYDEHGKVTGWLKAPGRKLYTTDAEGRVTGTITPEKYLRKMLAVRYGPDLDVVPGQRPTVMLCPDCTLAVYDVPKKKRVPPRCPECQAERYKCQEALPSGEKCGATVRAYLVCPSREARRRGRTATCGKCRVGRPKAAVDEGAVLQYIASGYSQRSAAKKCGVGLGTVQRIIARRGVSP